jgi:hypothetical protein
MRGHLSREVRHAQDGTQSRDCRPPRTGQLLLHLALNVLRPQAAENATQFALVDGVTDRLASSCTHLDEEMKLGGQSIPFPLLLDQKSAQGDACDGPDLYSVYPRWRPPLRRLHPAQRILIGGLA